MTAAYCSLVRLFRAHDLNLLYDGSSGALVSLSEGAFRAWERYLTAAGGGSDCGAASVAQGLAAPPPGLAELAGAGLFRLPQYPDQPLSQQGLHSLCLNVAHACDLACDYCFAGCGAYGSPSPSIMKPAVACAAIDYLMANSPPGRSLSVDFFGGEPLMAWPTVTETVRYGRERAASTGKTIHFTLTTNAVTMDDQRAAFCAENMSTLIVSLDGRPATHNRHRRTRSGEPSFEHALAGALRLKQAIEQRAQGITAGAAGAGGHATAGSGANHAVLHPDLPIGSGPLWIRGTFTRDNLDFWRDAEFLAGLGFGQVSMEPVTQPPNPNHAIRPEDLGAISESYTRIAQMVLAGRLRFFHYELNTESPACAPKRFTGCSAGGGYACVNPSGDVYPCHQFDGVEEYRSGTLAAGRTGSTAVGSPPPPPTYQPSRALASAHIGNKAACRECWAQLYCGGGCHYAAYKWRGDLLAPYPLGCALMKARLEAALAVQALLPRGDHGSPGVRSDRR